jgi:hypothetical protein
MVRDLGNWSASSWKATRGEKSRRKQELAKELHGGLFLTRPKTYESCTPTFFITITSFHDGYLMSGGFAGNRLPQPG